MARFAKVDKDNIVQTVHVVENKNLLNDQGEEEEVIGINFLIKVHGEEIGFTWIQSSYNTRGGVHSDGKTPFRKNHAGIGFTYDETRDAFIPPKPYDSWTLNEDTCIWDPPVAYPDDGKKYVWNEDTQAWDEIE